MAFFTVFDQGGRRRAIVRGEAPDCAKWKLKGRSLWQPDYDVRSMTGEDHQWLLAKFARSPESAQRKIVWADDPEPAPPAKPKA